MKVYVLENGACLAKKKTKVIKKTLDPSFQQSLLFDESPQGKVLQVGTQDTNWPQMRRHISRFVTYFDQKKKSWKKRTSEELMKHIG